MIDPTKKTVQKRPARPAVPASVLFDPAGLEIPGLQFSQSDLELLQHSLAGENCARILYALLLSCVSDDVNTVLEIVAGGGSSTAFALALKAAGKRGPKLFSVEIDPATPFATPGMLWKAREEFPELEWHVVYGDSLKVPLEQLPTVVDLLFIDGDHGGEHSIGDYRRFAPLVRSGGLVVFDDYPLFSGPAAAVAMLETEGVKGVKLTYNLQDGNSFYVIQK